MRRTLLGLTAIAIVTIVVLLAACDSEDESSYNVTIFWTIAGQKICQQPLSDKYGGGMLVFDTIQIMLYKNKNDEQPYRTSTARCEDASYTIEDLDRGNYWVEVEAMAEDPVTTVDGGATSTPSGQSHAYYVAAQEITVPSIDNKEYEFSLQMGTGSIDVSWDFAARGQCSAEWNAVTKVEVSLTGKLYNYNSGDVACEVGQYSFTDVDWDTYEVAVTGYDINGNSTHYGKSENPIEIRPGMAITGLDGLVSLEKTSP